MMFKREMAKLIFEKKKTQTRRKFSKSSRNYKVGSIQPIQISYREKAVGHVKITKAFVQRLGDMTHEEAAAEGFSSWAEFMGYLDKINKTHSLPTEIVKAYEFELVDGTLILYKFSCPYCGKVFEGTKAKFNKCFDHIAKTKGCRESHSVDPCYPINHCIRIEANGETYQHLP